MAARSISDEIGRSATTVATTASHLFETATVSAWRSRRSRPSTMNARLRPFIQPTVTGAPSAARTPLPADQVVVADPVDLVILRDAGGAIAEPDLGAQVERDVDAAFRRLALIGGAEAPLVDQERPLGLGPGPARRAGASSAAASGAFDQQQDRERDQTHGVFPGPEA